MEEAGHKVVHEECIKGGAPQGLSLGKAPQIPRILGLRLKENLASGFLTRERLLLFLRV